MNDFDPSTAKPVDSKFDPSSAKLVDTYNPATKTVEQKPSSKRPSLREAAPDYLKQAGVGAALGFAAPEILTGLGALAASSGVASPAAVPLFAAGNIARGARLAEATLGGIGAGAEAILKEQTPGAEKQLIPPTYYTPSVTRGEAAGLAGEVLAPGAALGATRFAPYVVRRAFPQETGIRPSTYQDEASLAMSDLRAPSRFAQMLPFGLGKISGTETRPQRAIAAALKLADKETADVVQKRMEEANQYAFQIRQRYKEMADSAAMTSRADAERLINEGEMRASEILNKAAVDAERSLNIARRSKRIGTEATRRMESSLASVGDQNVSDFQRGSDIQNKIKGNIDAEQKALNKKYDDDEKLVSDLVLTKESQGIAAKDTQSFDKLVDHVDKLLLAGKYKDATGFVPVTEPTLKNALINISKAVKDQKIFIGIDEAGNPVYKMVPTSWEAFDHVRRKLGEVFAGGEVEGFGGLLKEQAKDLYKLVRDVQVEYAGGKDGVFDNLLKNYSEGKELLNALKIPTGKKIVGTDKINPEYFTYDPSGLGNEFFKTRKKVQDLISLTKDADFVEKQASDHIARSLRNLNGKQVKDYIFNNKEWIDLFPQLSNKVNAYSRQLDRAERITPVTERLVTEQRGLVRGIGTKSIEDIAKESAAKARQEAAKQSQKRIEAGKKEVKKIATKGEAEAKRALGRPPATTRLLPPGNEVAAIENMILKADNEKLKQVASVVKTDKTLAKQFSDAVDITLSRMNPNAIYDDWNRKIRDPLVESGLISKEKAKLIDEKVKTVQMTLEPGVRVNTIRYLIKPLLIGETSEKIVKGE
jgi:hypothetical protein